MNLISLLDLVALLAALIALGVFVLRFRMAKLPGDASLLLLVILSLLLFYNLSNMLEWLRGADVFDLVSDVASILLSMLWGIFMYTFIRRHAEADLQASQQALRRERDIVTRIMETSPVGITVVNRMGEITFANAQAEQVLGLTVDDIVRRTYNAPQWKITAIDGGPFPDERLPFAMVMSTAQSHYDVRHAIEWPDGRRVILSINAAPLFDEMGTISAIVTTVEDITEHLHTQQEREALIQNLEGALAQVKTLSGLLPICANCKKIRDDRGQWRPLDVYVRDHSDAEFSHGLCPECARRLYPDYMDDLPK
ncbi:MAG: PAS domain-containing protein [Anaerolineae bacterium]|nr:PAS domain-containing protein [Anaerolineae bacterium]